MEAYTVITATNAVMGVKSAYEKSKWCQCGHRHPKKSSKSSGYKRKAACSDPACSCASFATQANQLELAEAMAYGKTKKHVKRGAKAAWKKAKKLF